MYSKFDSSYTINNTHWCITIARHGQHAMLLLEKHVEGEYELIKCDFIKDGDNDNSVEKYSKTFFSTKTYNGQVRKSCIIGAENMTKKQIFSKLKLVKGSTHTWRRPKLQIEGMEGQINQEIESQNEGKYLQFNIRGRYAKKNTDNCITWAIGKLKLVGIQHARSLLTKCVDCGSSALTKYHISDYKKNSKCVIL